MIKKIAALVLSAAMLAAVTSGCASFTGSSASGSSKDSTLNLYVNNDFPTLNQLDASDNIAYTLLNNVSEGLYREDTTNTPKPALAKSVDISSDGLTYTFHLRDGIKWSNGDPITSADFKYGWIRQMSADCTNGYDFILDDYIVGAQEYTDGKGSVDDIGVQTPDDKTLVVKLKAPTPYFLGLTTYAPYFPLNEKFMTAQGSNYGIGKDNVLYSGPYVISSYDAASGATLTKNDKYWDAANVKVQTVNVKVIKEASTALNLYKAGQLSRVALDATDVPTYKNSKEFSTHSVLRTYFIQYNVTAPGTGNADIRKALALSIDTKTLTDTVLNNGSGAAKGLLPDNMSSGIKGKTFESMQNLGTTYDAAQAKTYWQKGVAELGGKAPTLSLLSDDDSVTKDVATYVQSQYKKVLGIDVTVDSKTKKARMDQMKNSNYTIAINVWGADYDDPMTYLDLWTSHTNGFRGNFKSDAYDSLIKQAKAESDVTKRDNMLLSAEKTLVSDQNIVTPLYYLGYAYLTKSNVKNIVLTPLDSLELKYAYIK